MIKCEIVFAPPPPLPPPTDIVVLKMDRDAAEFLMTFIGRSCFTNGRADGFASQFYKTMGDAGIKTNADYSWDRATSSVPIFTYRP